MYGPLFVAAIVDLGVAPPCPHVVGELQAHVHLDFIGLEPRFLGLQVGAGLGLAVVLLYRKTDGVLILGPALLALEGVVAVIPRETDLPEAYLPRESPDVVREVFAGHGRSGRLDVTGDESGLVQGLHALFLRFAELGEVVRLSRPCPLTVGRLIYGLRLQRVLPAVEGHVHRVLRDAWYCGKVLGDRDIYLSVSIPPAGSRYGVAYGLGHLTPPSPTCTRVYAHSLGETTRIQGSGSRLSSDDGYAKGPAYLAETLGMNCGGRFSSVMEDEGPSSDSAAATASSTVLKASNPQRLATSGSFTPAK